MKHHKQMAAILAGVLSCAMAGATCYGTGSYQTCNDGAGNSYTARRYGDTTQVQGTNTQTGTPWSQTTRNVGNTTRYQGSAANGASWQGTSQPSGGATFHRGTDSQGNAYTRICPATGCF